MKCRVHLAIPTSVDPVAGSFAAGYFGGAHASECGESGTGFKAFGVIARGHEQCCGDVRSDTGWLQQGRVRAAGEFM